VIALFAISVPHLSTAQDKDGKQQRRARQTWEYKVLSTASLDGLGGLADKQRQFLEKQRQAFRNKTPQPRFGSEDLLAVRESALNKLAKDGWELLACPQTGQDYWIFKRAK
jgi:hypothetical protein